MILGPSNYSPLPNENPVKPFEQDDTLCFERYRSLVSKVESPLERRLVNSAVDSARSTLERMRFIFPATGSSANELLLYFVEEAEERRAQLASHSRQHENSSDDSDS